MHPYFYYALTTTGALLAACYLLLVWRRQTLLGRVASATAEALATVTTPPAAASPPAGLNDYLQLRDGRAATPPAPPSSVAAMPVVTIPSPGVVGGRPRKQPLVFELLKRHGRTTATTAAGAVGPERQAPLVRVRGAAGGDPLVAEVTGIKCDDGTTTLTLPLVPEGHDLVCYMTMPHDWDAVRVAVVNPCAADGSRALIHEVRATGNKTQRDGGDVLSALPGIFGGQQYHCLPLNNCFHFYRLRVVPNLDQDPRQVDLALDRGVLHFKFAQTVLMSHPLRALAEREGGVDVTVAGRPIGVEGLQQFELELTGLPEAGELRLKVIMEGMLVAGIAGLGEQVTPAQMVGATAAAAALSDPRF